MYWDFIYRFRDLSGAGFPLSCLHRSQRKSWSRTSHPNPETIGETRPGSLRHCPLTHYLLKGLLGLVFHSDFAGSEISETRRANLWIALLKFNVRIKLFSLLAWPPDDRTQLVLEFEARRTRGRLQLS